MATHTVVIVTHLPKESGGNLLSVIRERGIYPHVVKLYKGEQIPNVNTFDALISTGGLMSARSQSPLIQHELHSIREVLKVGKPYLGICLGLQTLVKAAGGNIVRSRRSEFGFREDAANSDSHPFSLHLTEQVRCDPLFAGFSVDVIPQTFQLHRATVELSSTMEYPATVLATDHNGLVSNQIVRVGQNAYGIQSHRELDHESLLLWLNQYARIGQFTIQDKWEIIREFDRIEPEFTQISKQIFNNFLDIVQASATPLQSSNSIYYPERNIL